MLDSGLGDTCDPARLAVSTKKCLSKELSSIAGIDGCNNIFQADSSANRPFPNQEICTKQEIVQNSEMVEFFSKGTGHFTTFAFQPRGHNGADIYSIITVFNGFRYCMVRTIPYTPYHIFM